MASRREHSSNTKDATAQNWRKAVPDSFTPELFYKMSKKIAQLTKVIYTLNSRTDEQEVLIHAMKESHEDHIQQITSDAKEKIDEFRMKISREEELLNQLQNLETQVLQERQEKSELQLEIENLRFQLSTAQTCHVCDNRMERLVSLYEDIRATKNEFQRKVGDFERLHEILMIDRTNNAVMSRSERTCMVNGHDDELSQAADNDLTDDELNRFVKDVRLLNGDGDFLSEGNGRIKSDFRVKVEDLKTFYEESLDKLKSSQKLGLANDLISCCGKQDLMNKQYDKLDVNFRRRVDDLLVQLSKSEEEIERYSKDIRHLYEELSKKDKRVIALEEQVKYDKEELTKLNSRLKQSEAALNQIKSASAQQKQEIINKTDKISMLEATRSEQEATIYRLQSEVAALNERVKDADIVRAEISKLQGAERENENTMALMQEEYERKLQEKQQLYNETTAQLEELLAVSKEESNCLKVIGEELKMSLEEQKRENDVMRERLKEFSSSLQSFQDDSKSLLLKVQELQDELKRKEEESERQQKEHLQQLEKKTAELNESWEERLMKELNKERERALSQGEEERSNAVQQILDLKENELISLDKLWKDKYDKANSELLSVRRELETIFEKHSLDRSLLKTDFEKERSSLKETIQKYTEEVMHMKEEHQRNLTLLNEQKSLVIQNLDSLKKQHEAELLVQGEKHREALQKLKLDNELQVKELSKNLTNQYQGKIDALEKQLKEESNRKECEVSSRYQQEVQKIRKEMEVALREVQEKGEAWAARERELKKDLREHKYELDQYRNLLEKLNSEMDSVSRELECKKDEVLKIRIEAAQQIKNLEIYWQRRITKELKDNAILFDKEKQSMQDRFNRTQQLLKDKISSLEFMIQMQDKQEKDGSVSENHTSDEVKDGNTDSENSSKTNENKILTAIELFNQRCKQNKSQAIPVTTSALYSPRLLKKSQNNTENSRSMLPRRPSLPSSPPNGDNQHITFIKTYKESGGVSSPKTPASESSSKKLDVHPSKLGSPDLSLPRRLKPLEANPKPNAELSNPKTSQDGGGGAKTSQFQKKSVWFSDSKPLVNEIPSKRTTPSKAPPVSPSSSPNLRNSPRFQDRAKDSGNNSSSDDSRSYSIPRMIGDTFRKIKSYRREGSPLQDGDVEKRNGSKFYTALPTKSSPRIGRAQNSVANNRCDTIKECDEGGSSSSATERRAAAQ